MRADAKLQAAATVRKVVLILHEALLWRWVRDEQYGGGSWMINAELRREQEAHAQTSRAGYSWIYVPQVIQRDSKLGNIAASFSPAFLLLHAANKEQSLLCQEVAQNS